MIQEVEHRTRAFGSAADRLKGDAVNRYSLSRRARAARG
jgi:hypothetical protein